MGLFYSRESFARPNDLGESSRVSSYQFAKKIKKKRKKKKSQKIDDMDDEELLQKKQEYARFYSLWLSPILGTIVLTGDRKLKGSSYYGSLFGVKSGLGISSEKYSYYLNLSWANTKIGVEAKEEEFGEKKPHTIITNFAGIDASIDFRWKWFDLGPVLLLPFGADTSFEPFVNKGWLPHFYLGGSIKIGHIDPSDSDFLRYGFHIFKDLNVGDRSVYFMMFSVSFGIPLFVEPKYLVKTKIKTKTKIRTKTKIKIKKEYVDKVKTVVRRFYFVDAGIINFETNKFDISGNNRKYLHAVGKYLGKNKDLWHRIIINAHADKRGSFKYNQQLSRKRGKSVTAIFNAEGIGDDLMIVKIKGFTDPVESDQSSVALARNRRIEISILGKNSMPKVKRNLLRLNQKYRVPATCGEDECK